MRPFPSCIIRLIFALSLALFYGCATLPSLEVTFSAKASPNKRKKKMIYVDIVDKRVNRDIIGAGAKNLYKNFPGNVTLILKKSRTERFNAGVYEIDGLFRYTFDLYLKGMGFRLLNEPRPDAPELVITVYGFVLDLSGRRWISRIAYEAEFIRDQKVVVRRFKGEGEKYRIEGLTQAHKVMSETFTDIVHQLDLERLYSHAAK